MKIISWILRIVASIILLQTLYFKFSASPESVYIFTSLGIEPFGRIGSGIAELITAVLLMLPRTVFWGAVLGTATMLGAIFSHIFVLGIEVKNDGGTLFALALITFLSCLILIIYNKDKIPDLLKFKK